LRILITEYLFFTFTQTTEPRLIFFGRKFEPVVSQEIINKLELWLYPERYEVHSFSSNRYWESIYHHFDLSPQPNKVLLSVGRTLGLVLVHSFLSSLNKENSTAHWDYEKNSLKLEEIVGYHMEDSLQGILVISSFNVSVKMKSTSGESVSQIRVRLEGLFRIKNTAFAASESKSVRKHLSSILVRFHRGMSWLLIPVIKILTEKYFTFLGY